MSSVCQCTTSQVWRPLLSLDGYYEVSDHGQVRSVDRVITDSLGRSRRIKGFALALSQHPSGHLHVRLSISGVGATRKVHHLVLEAFVGPRPPGQEGCHWDDDPGNNHLPNLRWGTRSDNMQDAIRNGINHLVNRAHCPFDHVLAMPNLVPSCLPRRGCLACSRASSLVKNAWTRKGIVLNYRTEADRYYDRIMINEGSNRKIGVLL